MSFFSIKNPETFLFMDKCQLNFRKVLSSPQSFAKKKNMNDFLEISAFFDLILLQNLVKKNNTFFQFSHWFPLKKP